MYKVIFQKWFKDKQISLISYKDSWSKNGTGRRFKIWTNGARKGIDSCFDLHIDIGYLAFNYTNFNYSR